MKRDFLLKAWRMAAIYRCCIRFEAPHDWAIERVRELYPDGSRDRDVENWFTDMPDLCQSRGSQDISQDFSMAA